jgi:hypothetical protein
MEGLAEGVGSEPRKGLLVWHGSAGAPHPASVAAAEFDIQGITEVRRPTCMCLFIV